MTKPTRLRKKDYPLLRGFVRRNTDGVHHVIECWCPYCRTWHAHGWDERNRRPEHRWAHCSDGSPFRDKGYLIAPFTQSDLRKVEVAS